MNKEALEAEKAEVIQSVKALLIPLCLFLACVIMAAGTFLIYSGESCGWGFVIVSTVTVISCFVALIRFQNRYRARGIIKNQEDEVVLAQPARVVRIGERQEADFDVTPPVSATASVNLVAAPQASLTSVE